MRRWRKENQVVAMGPKIARKGERGVRCCVLYTKFLVCERSEKSSKTKKTFNSFFFFLN